MDTVTLRPVRESDLWFFDLRDATPQTDPYNFFGFRASDHARRTFAENGLLGGEFSTLLVIVEDEVVGDVGWYVQRYGPPSTGIAYGIGVALLPQFRGKGYGSTAQRVLADHLFATQPINRLEAGTDITNIAEQKALVKAGFTREGVARGAQFRAGEWRDMVIFSRLRSDT